MYNTPTKKERAHEEHTRLRNRFPLFEFDDPYLCERKGALEGQWACRVQLSEHSRTTISLSNRRPGERSKIKQRHRLESIRQSLQRLYPNLQIMVTDGDEATNVETWVYGSGTAMNLHRPRLDELGFHDEMARRDKIAAKASQEGNFYCTGCREVHSSDEYSFFHFAGRYCKTYGKENPDHKRRALSETYN